MSRFSVRRVLGAGVAGAAVAVTVTVGGAIPGMASAAVLTTTPSTQLAATLGPDSIAHLAAASAPMQGDSGRFEVFPDFDEQGGGIDLTNQTIADLRSIGLNDTISSVANKTGGSVCMFTDVNFGSHRLKVLPNQVISFQDIGFQGFQDQISSLGPC